MATGATTNIAGTSGISPRPAAGESAGSFLTSAAAYLIGSGRIAPRPAALQPATSSAQNIANLNVMGRNGQLS